MGTAAIFAELKELRRGRGLLAADAPARIGPRLRAICNVLSTDELHIVRRKIVLRLTELCSQLPEDLRLAALVALALHDGNERETDRLLHKRVEGLAKQFDRDPRTALRRIDQALWLLAEHLAGGMVPATDETADASLIPDGWYTEALHAVLRMDLDPPQVTEKRRIVATADELDEIVISVSAPKDIRDQDWQDNLVACMIYGGEVVEVRRPGRSHTDFIVRLPKPLALGQRHEYSVQLTSYPRQWFRPYLVMTPFRRCETFTVKVRFPKDDLPVQVWRLNGIPPTVLDDLEPNDDIIAPDSVGEVHVEFHDLRTAVSYGLGWRASTGKGWLSKPT